MKKLKRKLNQAFSSDRHPIRILMLGYLCFFLLLSLLSGCMNPQKAVGYLKRKNLLADTCAANFPIKETVEISELIVRDTVFPEGYELALEREEEGVITPEEGRKGKPTNTVLIRETVYRDKIVRVRDTAGQVVMEKRIEEGDRELERLKGVNGELRAQMGERSRRILYLYLIIAILVAWIGRRQILRLFSPVVERFK